MLILIYLLVFWLAVGLFSLGASRRWVLATSAIGPGIVSAFTWRQLVACVDELSENGWLNKTVTYYNAEAAFLLVASG